MPSSQSLGEDPGNTPHTAVPPPEDDDECGIQHDAGPRLACQFPSSGTPTAFHSSTLGQEERPSPCISIATLADLPLSTANTTNATHSHSDSKVQLKDRGDPIDVSDSERQESDDPDDDEWSTVEEYAIWHQSRVSSEAFRENIQKARDVALENCLDLKQIHEDQDPEFFVKHGVKAGAARRFVSDIAQWVMRQGNANGREE
ncbi:hypothetical protein N7468_008504 [Penicillium chermesinum]|uniref:Uncharacterized protein n=1 Tax=Penicillium chermesinum TaxID=63820 RepID=A0A9W9NPU5_9EURO|nr:uncharacterized protein N7468_008504 [Penicillium chermesinum]KAJ5223962.1 hypothetical protein N7468_008504 [Penicillium chermesinum]KAJ6155219.1 hypothetical protein N7470_005785 [Penicillium chermesinum]